MPLAFVDTNGGKGWIKDDLSVVHYGQAAITEPVEAYIEGLDGDDSSPPDDEWQRLVIELPRACLIREIVQLDGVMDPL